MHSVCEVQRLEVEEGGAELLHLPVNRGENVPNTCVERVCCKPSASLESTQRRRRGQSFGAECGRVYCRIEMRQGPLPMRKARRWPRLLGK